MTPRPQQATRRTTILRREAVVAAVPVAVAALLVAAGPAAAGTVGSSGAGDTYFPLSGNGGYDVRHYDLTLGYDPQSRHLDGKAVITARATQRLTRFDLDFKGLKVTGVTVDRAKASYHRDGQELVVTPATPSSGIRNSESLSPTRARPSRPPTRTAPWTGGSPPTTARSWPANRRAP